MDESQREFMRELNDRKDSFVYRLNLANGGDEGTRTLDLWRDRPAF